MITKHVSDSTIRKATNDDLIEFFREALKLIKNSQEIIKIGQDFTDGEIDEDDEIDLLEDCIYDDTGAILMFKNSCLSTYPSINFYMQDLLDVINTNTKNIQSICDSGVYVTEEWRSLLLEQNEKIIGGMCYVLWYDFQLDKYVDSKDSDDVIIDNILKGYCDTESIPVEDVVAYIEQMRKEYKFKLLVFDECPEKEEPFIAVMGPYLGNLDQSKLTMKLVDSVLAGEITPEELCMQIALSSGSIEGVED